MIEVRDKIREISGLKPHQQRDYFAARPMPAVQGSEGHPYLTDHHHLARAAWEAGVEKVFVHRDADWSGLASVDFWQRMQTMHWVHPIDEHGVRRSITDLPDHVRNLRDDVYRSLARYVRAAGGFEKTATPYAEFAWANWFRSRVVIEPTPSGFDAAVRSALALTRTSAAHALPGYDGNPGAAGS